jgi:hypothetical protein
MTQTGFVFYGIAMSNQGFTTTILHGDRRRGTEFGATHAPIHPSVAFGYPTAHENDTLRAVRTGLDLCEAIHHLSGQSQREVGESLEVRVGIHRGLVFVDTVPPVCAITAPTVSRSSWLWSSLETVFRWRTAPSPATRAT